MNFHTFCASPHTLRALYACPPCVWGIILHVKDILMEKAVTTTERQVGVAQVSSCLPSSQQRDSDSPTRCTTPAAQQRCEVLGGAIGLGSELH